MGILICAPDKFRDALTATQAATAMSRGGTSAGWIAVPHPLADGGEGTREAILSSAGGSLKTTSSVDAIGRATDAPYVMTDSQTAIVVASDILGLRSLQRNELDPLSASSRGLAHPILAAVDNGAKRITVFLGGVATVDGGLGLLSALGASITDGDGAELVGAGRDLATVQQVDLYGARSRLAGVTLTVATDVESPLCGPEGAAYVFGPQKGASAEEVQLLDQGLERLSGMLGTRGNEPGAGAAGGIGAALMAIGGRRTSGAEAVLSVTGFASKLEGAQLCITGEGKVDRGTSAGKAVAAIIRACREAAVPCVVLGGALTTEAERLYDLSPAGIFAIGRKPRLLTDALRETAHDLERTTRAVCELASAFRRQAYTEPDGHPDFDTDPALVAARPPSDPEAAT